jgi:TolB protein
VQHEEQQGSIWVKQIATGSSFQTVPPSSKGYRSLAFSPDGKYLYFREEEDPGSIYQISTFGGAPKRLAENVWSDFSLSPDGTQFAFTRRESGRDSRFLVLSNIDGGGESEPISRQSLLDYGTAAPAWSPDGSRIVVNVGARLRMVDVVTGGTTELKTRAWRAISRILWMPDGEHLVFSARAPDESSSQVWMVTYTDGTVRRLTNDLEGYFWLSLSADGRLLVARQQRIVLHLWLLRDGNLKKARQLTFGERNFDGYAGLAWTPDGKIVASIFAGQNTDLYSMNADGSNRVQLTVNAGRDNTDPVISNDGRYIVFTSNRSGTRQIWRMDIDGRNQRQLTQGEGPGESAQSPALMPGGTEVFFIQQGAGRASIWRVPIEGGSPVPGPSIPNAMTGGLLSISPDGKLVAYRHTPTGSEARSEERTLSIGLLPVDGSAEPKVFDLQMRRLTIQWSGDSWSFYYAAGVFDSSSLWRQPVNRGNPQKLLDFPDRVFNFAWSRDGRNLVVSRGTQRGDAILITNLP